MRAVLVLALALGAAQAGSATPPPAATRPVGLTDAEAAQLARESLGATDPVAIRAVLGRLRSHSFKSSKVPEREMVLYAQGVLEARIGNLPAAAVSLKKLEQQWPNGPFTGEAQCLLAEDAIGRRRYKEAEGYLHRALAADMPAERKRHAQEWLVLALAEQGRAQEALPMVKALRAQGSRSRTPEAVLAAMVEVLCAAGTREQAEAARAEFQQAHPAGGAGPKVDLAYGRLQARSGDRQGAAQTFRKLLADHPRSAQADDARLALANLLSDGKGGEAQDMPSAEALLAEARKGGKALPKGAAQVVELRVLTGKGAWEEALVLTDGLDPSLRQDPEVRSLWKGAWNGWVGQRLERGRPGELLPRLKPGCFEALEARLRTGVVEALAAGGLLATVPPLLAEVPEAQRAGLRRAALARAAVEVQPQAALRLAGPSGGGPELSLARVRALAALQDWGQVRAALPAASPGPERIAVVVRLLQRPLGPQEKPAQRLGEAEGWLARCAERGAAQEPLAILVADLRFRAGDARGALALYPARVEAGPQRGWVALMRAEAMVRLGQRDDARSLILEARAEPAFKGQRDALAHVLGAY